MLVLTTLDRGDSVAPLAAERSRRVLARGDYLAGSEIGGDQEVVSSRQGDEVSRPLGIGGILG